MVNKREMFACGSLNAYVGLASQGERQQRMREASMAAFATVS